MKTHTLRNTHVMILILFAAAAIPTPRAHAQTFGGFAPHVTFPVGTSPSSVAIGDLNGDGALDLAAANVGLSPTFLGTTISILLGDGLGGFAAQQTFQTGSGPVSVAMGDLNGDSSPDIAVANFTSNNVSILINQTDAIAPGAFDLLSPADSSSGLPLPDVMLAWPGGGATAPVSWSLATGFSNTYTFTIATDPALANVVFQETGLTDTNTDVPTGVINVSTRYYWGVTAVNQAGSTPSTSVFTFTTATPADFNGDGSVNGADLAQLLTNWGMLP